MNHSYESVKSTMITQGIDIPESYIEKALKEYGFERFPEAGLEDNGLGKLVKRATDIAHSEAQLIPRKTKKDYLPVPKIKKEKESRLENSVGSVMKEDLKKVGKFIKNISCMLGTVPYIPTIARKYQEGDFKGSLVVANNYDLIFISGCIEDLAFAITEGLAIGNVINQKAGIGILVATLTTNLASGIYEYVRHVKKRREDKCYETKNHCNICLNDRCSYY
jgi:hypothetical protein